MATRRLRSTSKKTEVSSSSDSASPLVPSITWLTGGKNASACSIQLSGSKSMNLPADDLVILRKKQRKLIGELPDTQATLLGYLDHFRTSLASTLIFAQESAGTAVCISSGGLLLTCAHCIAETESEYKEFKSAWLLTYDGTSVQAECIFWDDIRDVALLQIVTIEADITRISEGIPKFASVSLGSISQSGPICCIGQPGRDDLESKTARKTTYQLVEISQGHLRGYVADANLQDNSEIGSLKHDAWTYWGHSGAPLLNSDNGKLLGLHSSWDDQTAMRHGVPLVAVREFLKNFVDSTDHVRRGEINQLLKSSHHVDANSV